MCGSHGFISVYKISIFLYTIAINIDLLYFKEYGNNYSFFLFWHLLWLVRIFFALRFSPPLLHSILWECVCVCVFCVCVWVVCLWFDVSASARTNSQKRGAPHFLRVFNGTVWSSKHHNTAAWRVSGSGFVCLFSSDLNKRIFFRERVRLPPCLLPVRFKRQTSTEAAVAAAILFLFAFAGGMDNKPVLGWTCVCAIDFVCFLFCLLNVICCHLTHGWRLVLYSLLFCFGSLSFELSLLSSKWAFAWQNLVGLENVVVATAWRFAEECVCMENNSTRHLESILESTKQKEWVWNVNFFFNAMFLYC